MIDTFFNELNVLGFSGDCCMDQATRMVMATDNSIYQVIPAAVVFPAHATDCKRLFTLAQKKKYENLRFSPRGGGTGTNGQSLTEHIVIDTSRYMNRIIEINIAEEYVVVESGVVIDQLNDALAKHGYFFAPNCATSSRATIGGNINTDACGEGSAVYGRTSNHVVSIDVEFISTPPTNQMIQTVLRQHESEIKRVFPNLKRFMTGYNLAHAMNGSPIKHLICGSEGTLGLVTAATLKIMPIPTYKQLVIGMYNTLDDALVDVPEILKRCPTRYELLDDTLVNLAKLDGRFDDVAHYLKSNVLIVMEFTDEQGVRSVCKHNPSFTCIPNDLAARFWSLRKTAVGLMGNLEGNRKPIPFIEDTAVDPIHLSQYINDVKSILDSYHLSYGIYGHPDVGCLHIRPALDLTNELDEQFVTEITERVYQLVKSYNGVLWAEHGKGFRSVYTHDHVGDTIYQLYRDVKTWFDPLNRLNPGKIALPNNSSDTLVTISGPLRGQYDRQLSMARQKTYADSIRCNGNGACFNYHADTVMCPSWIATRDRVQSPKGRAVVLREWNRLKTRQDPSLSHFEQQTFKALDTCLSCKACTNNCPIHVNIPELKTQFLAEYYMAHRRPLRDYIIANQERLFIRIPRVCAWALTRAPLIGMQLTNTPKVMMLTPQTKSIPKTVPNNAVLIVQDIFTSLFRPEVLDATIQLLKKLEYEPFLIPIFENGKAWHIKGFLSQFKAIVNQNIETLNAYLNHGVPIIGIEPSTTLTYADEYVKYGEKKLNGSIMLIQEFLQSIDAPPQLQSDSPLILLGHCMERTDQRLLLSMWQTVFRAWGLSVSIPELGCCGMAGIFGHEMEHVALSRQIYELSWKPFIDRQHKPTLMATGFSCQSQVNRFSHETIPHPVQVLLSGLH